MRHTTRLLVLVATLRNVLGLNQIGGDAQGVMIGLLLIVSLLASNIATTALPALRRLLSSSRPGGPDSGGRPAIPIKSPK